MAAPGPQAQAEAHIALWQATALATMKKNTGARWEITVDGKPRTYDHNMQLAIEAAEYLKLKNPGLDPHEALTARSYPKPDAARCRSQ